MEKDKEVGEVEKCEKCGGELFKLKFVQYGYAVEAECVKCGDKKEYGG